MFDLIRSIADNRYRRVRRMVGRSGLATAVLGWFQSYARQLETNRSANVVDTGGLSARLRFTCNICGTACDCPVSDLGRETPSCPTCASTVRLRSLARCLTLRLVGEPTVLAALPSTAVGIGLSDHPGLAQALESASKYTNTAYHQEPHLDITAPALHWLSSADYLSSSDVFEHVIMPVQLAFDGAFKVLRPGGWLILTVPFGPIGSLPTTIEHFPDLHDWSIETADDGHKVVVNQRTDGTVERFEDPVFHGGDGFTLEMRIFEEQALVDHLRSAGFVDISVHDESDLNWGIFWSNNRASVPISARRPS